MKTDGSKTCSFRIFKRSIRYTYNDNEDKFLILCSMLEISDSSLSEIKKLISLDLNWDYILKNAFKYRITSLIYHNLRKVSNNYKIPQEVKNKLREVYKNKFYYNMYLYSKLNIVLKAFEDKGIDVIILKGAALAKIVYQNVALREMCDVDLLIKKEDLNKASNIMSLLGYFPKEKDVPPTWLDKYSNEVHFINTKKGRGSIDLHWDLACPRIFFSVEMNKVWERCKKATICNKNVLILSSEDMIIHLCVHYSFGHNYNNGLRDLSDINAIIEKDKNLINWQDLLTYANEYGLDHCIYGALLFTRRIFKTEIPTGFLQQLRHNCNKIFVYWVEHKSEKNIIHPNSRNLETLIKLSLIKENINKKKYLNLIFFPPIDLLASKHSFLPTSRIDYFVNLLSLQKRHIVKIYDKWLGKSAV